MPGTIMPVSLISKSVRRATYLLIEVFLAPWTWKCEKEDVVITDVMLKAKAMELAKEHHMLDPPRPFACSPKWLRKAKAHLHIVNGRIVNRKETSQRSRDGPSGSITPELRVSPLPEPSEASPETLSSQPSAEMTCASGIATSSASGNPPFHLPFRSSIVGPHADTDALLPTFPPTFASSSIQGSTDSLSIWAQDTSSLSTVEHAPPGLSYQTPSPRSSPELYTLDWLHMPELAASADHDEHDGMHDAPASELGSTIRSDMRTPFLLTDGLISGPPTLPVMHASIPPPVADGYAGPVPLAPLDYIVPTDGVPTDSASFFSPLPDPPALSSSIWSTNASPTLASSVDFPAPSMSLQDSLGTLVPQLACVPQEDIDRLATEMMHWPIEALLDDIGVPMSQTHATYPCGEMSLGTPMLSNRSYASLDGLGNTDFVPA